MKSYMGRNVRRSPFGISRDGGPRSKVFPLANGDFGVLWKGVVQASTFGDREAAQRHLDSLHAGLLGDTNA